MGHESTDASELDQACMPNMVRARALFQLAALLSSTRRRGTVRCRIGVHTRGGVHPSAFALRSASTVAHLAAGGSRAAGGLGGMREGTLSPARCSEKDAKLAQKLGQLSSFMAVFPQKCMGQLVSFGPT